MNKEQIERMQGVREFTRKELTRRMRIALETYAECQKRVDNSIINHVLKDKKLKKLDKYFYKMGIIDRYCAEIGKTYYLIFDEDLDVAAMTRDAVKKVYPKLYDMQVKRAYQNKFKDYVDQGLSEEGIDPSKVRGFDLNVSSDISELPEDIQDFGAVLQEALRKAGKGNVQMRFVDMSSGREYEFPEETSNEKVSESEVKKIMTDNIIHMAEDEATGKRPISKSKKNEKPN